MNFNDLHFLTRITSIVQIAAIIFIVIGGLLQASRFILDKKIENLKQPQKSRAALPKTALMRKNTSVRTTVHEILIQQTLCHTDCIIFPM